MSISYNTSTTGRVVKFYDKTLDQWIEKEPFLVSIPTTQQQILSINEDFVPKTSVYIDSEGEPRTEYHYTPHRNRHTFGALYHNQTHDFYFSPNYNYDRNSIVEYQQVVIQGEDDEYGIYWEDLIDSKNS